MKLGKHLKRKNSSRYYSTAVKKSNFVKNLHDNYLSRNGLTKKDLQQKIDNQSQCGSLLILDYDIKKPIDDMNVVQSNFCGNKDTCTLCASRNQYKKRQKYVPKIKEVNKRSKYAYFITYTIKNGNNLNERLQHLRTSLEQFRKLGQKRNGFFDSGEYSKVHAGILGIEAKKGRNSGSWHVHGHGIFFTDEKLDYSLYNTDRMDDYSYSIWQKKRRTKEEKDHLVRYAKNIITYNGKKIAMSKISMEWYRCTGDSINMHVKKINRDPVTGEIDERQIVEALKYATKPNANNPIDFLEISDAFYNRRTLSTYGELYKLGDINKNELNDEIKNTTSHIALEYDYRNWGYKPHNENLESIYTKINYNENIKKTMQQVGKELGKYRRERRQILNQEYFGIIYDEFGNNNIVSLLNATKKMFREKIKSLWKAVSEKNNLLLGCT